MVTAPPRMWRLRGFRKVIRDEKPVVETVHDETCVGDDGLDAALRRLERRPDLTSIKAEPETLAGGRPLLSEPVVLPSEPEPDYECLVCELPESDCRRRAAVNGHEFERGRPKWTT